MNTATPTVAAFAGNQSADNSNAVIGAYNIFCTVFNGASSVLQIDATTATTGNFGASAMNGFTLGASGAASNGTHCDVKEALIYTAALDATQRAAVRTYLATVP